MIAPYFFQDEDEPRYQLAFILMMVMGFIACASAMGLKYYLFRSNKKLYAEGLRNGTPYQPYVR